MNIFLKFLNVLFHPRTDISKCDWIFSYSNLHLYELSKIIHHFFNSVISFIMSGFCGIVIIFATLLPFFDVRITMSLNYIYFVHSFPSRPYFSWGKGVQKIRPRGQGVCKMDVCLLEYLIMSRGLGAIHTLRGYIFGYLLFSSQILNVVKLSFG